MLEYGIDVNAQNGVGMTPLHIALEESEYRGPEMVVLLLEYGADANAQNIVGMTPLHIAALTDATEMAFVLLESGAAQSRNNRGATPLDEAINNRATQTAELLQQNRRWVQFFAATNLLPSR